MGRPPALALSAVVLCLACSMTTSGQSLGDVARKQRESHAQQRKPGRVFTDDDVKTKSADQIPDIAGMKKCGKETACFVVAVEGGKPASLEHAETVEEGTGVLTAASTWWSTGCKLDKCEVSFRLDSFKAAPNEKVVEGLPAEARKHAEARLADANRDSEAIIGKANTCAVAAKDLRRAFTSPRLSFVGLGGLADMGKACTGPMFAKPSR